MLHALPFADDKCVKDDGEVVDLYGMPVSCEELGLRDNPPWYESAANSVSDKTDQFLNWVTSESILPPIILWVIAAVGLIVWFHWRDKRSNNTAG